MADRGDARMSPGFAVALTVLSLIATIGLNTRAINRRRDRGRDAQATAHRRHRL